LNRKALIIAFSSAIFGFSGSNTLAAIIDPGTFAHFSTSELLHVPAM